MESRRVVTLQDVEVRAPDGRRLLRVEHLGVDAGDRVAVTGPSGAGKSLLLSLLAGRRLPGLEVRNRPHDSARGGGCGVVPQRGLDALHPLVPLGRQLRRVTGAPAARVASVLDDLGLAALGGRRPAQLSGGQAQRGAIALAVLAGAPLVVADELTSALDHRTRDETLALLDRVLGEHTALVVATHDAEVLDALAGPGPQGSEASQQPRRPVRRVRVAAGLVSEDQP